MTDAKRCFGSPIPYLDTSNLPGKLIAVEGTDGVGRSTQVERLRLWLESLGYAVIVTGLTRSNLAKRGIDRAKEGHTLGRITFSLFYATDFADLYENTIIPGLRSGFVVLADRYIFTSLVRAKVRSLDLDWIREVYGFALVPDLVFYLDINVDDLVHRVLNSKGFDYWESGMDVDFGHDLFESFTNYQTAIIREFRRIAAEYRFRVVDACQSPEAINAQLRGPIAELLNIETSSAAAVTALSTRGQ